jgi:hypothetical protein
MRSGTDALGAIMMKEKLTSGAGLYRRLGHSQICYISIKELRDPLEDHVSIHSVITLSSGIPSTRVLEYRVHSILQRLDAMMHKINCYGHSSQSGVLQFINGIKKSMDLSHIFIRNPFMPLGTAVGDKPWALEH